MKAGTVFGVTATAMGWAGVAVANGVIVRATLFHRSEVAAAGDLAAFGALPASGAEVDEPLALLRSYAAGEPAPIHEFPAEPHEGTNLQRLVWCSLRE
ncbi:MAG TPA: hypothetical protein PKD27_13055, partial [Tepidiformaceae bacterium]|nr:hypothetical protein [Tepidiformaceae bacterium]